MDKVIEKISINEHSSIRIAGEIIIHFDPFRIKKETNDADIVFVTHAHYDHFSPEDIEKICHKDTIFVMPTSIYRRKHRFYGSRGRYFCERCNH